MGDATAVNKGLSAPPRGAGRTKDSGFGRERLKYAVEDQTEIRLMVLNRP